MQNHAYAHLKTIDGIEVKEYTKPQFESLLEQLKTRIVNKSDRTLHFVLDNTKTHGIQFYKDDYFEVLDSSR